MPYASEYLLGFSAERYAIDPGAAWHTARRTIGHSQERRCAADVPGDRQRSLRASHTFAAVRFAHVLLPMWIAAYRYRGRLHRFIINGQTGEISGQAPLSAGKLGLLLAIAVALLFALVLLLHSRPLLPPLVP
jgi:hypothetical protein